MTPTDAGSPRIAAAAPDSPRLGPQTDADRLLATARLDLDRVADALAASDPLGVYVAAQQLAATAARIEALAVRVAP